MSTVKAANLANADATKSLAVDNIIDGSAKVWANLNGTGTIALRDSQNVTSVTDNGTGDYTFNITNAMSDTNYMFLGAGGTGSPGGINDIDVSRVDLVATTGRFQAVRGSNNTLTDFAIVQVVAQGDLA